MFGNKSKRIAELEELICRRDARIVDLLRIKETHDDMYDKLLKAYVDSAKEIKSLKEKLNTEAAPLSSTTQKAVLTAMHDNGIRVASTTEYDSLKSQIDKLRIDNIHLIGERGKIKDELKTVREKNEALIEENAELKTILTIMCMPDPVPAPIKVKPKKVEKDDSDVQKS